MAWRMYYGYPNYLFPLYGASMCDPPNRAYADGGAQKHTARFLTGVLTAFFSIRTNLPHQLFHPTPTSRDHHQRHNDYSDLYV